MEDGELHRYAREAFRSMNPETTHICLEDLAEFAQAKGAGTSWREAEKHLAECALCRERLAEFEQFLLDSQRPAAQNLKQEWEELHRRIRPYKSAAVMRRWLPAIAAALILAAGFSWIAIGLLNPSPTRLLAQAYQEQRTSEFRQAGAAYAPVRVERGAGSAFALPPALLKAQARLAEQLKSSPDDPDVLRLQGEAEIMAHDAAAAVRTLEKARDFRPQDARILADLGTAYALRGDLERQVSDYPSALENLSRALHLQTHVPEVVFNRALVLERMMLFDQAIQEWQNYLQLDSVGGWAEEARKHLSGLQKKMKSREDRLGELLDDPAQFLVLATAGGTINAEGYLQVAVARWLPLTEPDSRAREAIKELARLLQQKHGDSWLSDLAASARGPEKLKGLQQLAVARLANQEGRATEALAAARKARASFLLAGCLQGVLWADFEEVYGLKLASKADECLTSAERLDRNLKPFSYIWLRARNRIEYAICAMRLGRFAEATPHLTSALAASRKAGFDDAALRANGMYLEIMTNIAAPTEIFSKAEDFLRTFWGGAYPALRFYQVTAGFVETATNDGQGFVAYFLARSAVWAASLSRNPLVEATARAKLAVAALAVGEEAEARAAIARSENFFAGTQGNMLAPYRLEPQIAFAKLELERGDIEAGMKRLQALHDALLSPPSVRIAAQYYSVLGEAYRRKGSLALAARAFRRSIDFGTQRVASLASERERAGALRIIDDSYRGLVAATLSIPGGSPEEALSIWQQYRSLDAAQEPANPRQSGAAVLSFAELPDGFVGWLVRGRQVTMRKLPVSKQDARTVAVRFLRLCSGPDGTWHSLRQDSQQIYNWMIGPFEDQLKGGSPERLIVEPDGILAEIPLQVLLSGNGTYLGDRFFLLDSVGLMPAPLRDDVLQRSARVLVVASPAVLGESARRFPPLPDSLKEADVVRNSFPDTAIIQDRQATLAALMDWLPTVEIVHLSGHGYTNAGNGALLFAPRDADNADYDLLRAVEVSRQDWSRVRLVMLSACATASGETQGPHNPESLVRALTRAGASRVTASLWNVDSAATLELMTAFYASLGQGNSSAQALRTAQQRVRSRAEWAHPYYWAGFQLYGTT